MSDIQRPWTEVYFFLVAKIFPEKEKNHCQVSDYEACVIFY